MSERLTYCGIPEHLLAALVGSRWHKPALRYAIRAQLGALAPAKVQEIYARAWKSWTDVCGILAGPAADAQGADVTATGGPIDGPRGVLAWSHLPAGDDRPLQQLYDSAEAWAEEFALGVFTHEIGHALGLDHAAQGSPDIMAPFFRANVVTPQPGDVARVRALYPPAVPPPPPPPPPAGDPSDVMIILGRSGHELSRFKLTRI